MTLDEFAAVSQTRIPTPKEFIGFVRGQGWAFKVDGEKAWLYRVPPDDMPVAQATAAMLKREPYRTNVLRELLAEPVRESPPEGRQAEVVRLAGEAAAPARETLPCVTPEVCHGCRATIYLPGPEIAAVCDKTPCPYFRLKR